MLVRVTLDYECEGGADECLALLKNSYRPRQGRVESFSSGHRVEGAFISDRGSCVSFAVDLIEGT